jgi:hypothetical protein
MTELYLDAPSHQLLDASGKALARAHCMQLLGRDEDWLRLMSANGKCIACQRSITRLDEQIAPDEFSLLRGIALRHTLETNGIACFASSALIPKWPGAAQTPFASGDVKLLPQIRMTRSIDEANAALRKDLYPVVVCAHMPPQPERSLEWVEYTQNLDGTVEIHVGLELMLNRTVQLRTRTNAIRHGRFIREIFTSRTNFCAYLLPRNLPTGQRVYIPKLGHPALKKTQNGIAEALSSCEAIWHGDELIFVLPYVEEHWVIG